jgi:phosphate-selective porin OprO and OprP
MNRIGRLAMTLLVAAWASMPAQAQEKNDPKDRLNQLEQMVAALKVEAAAAQTGPSTRAVSDLEKRILELEAKIAELQKSQQPPEAKLMNNDEQERAQEPVGVAGFYDNGYLVATSRDGAFKYWLDGRVNLDFATYPGATNRLPTGAEVRRARLGVKATVFTNWLAEVDIDFTDNLVEIKDLWAGYAGFENLIIRAGSHKAPFGFDTLTSSKNIMFIERSYLDSWSPDRLLGVSATRWGKRWQVSAGFFGEPAGNFDDKDSLTGGGAGTSQDYNVVGRLSGAPYLDNGNVLHLGVAGAYRTPERQKLATSGADLPDRVNAARIVKLDSRAETHVSRAKFLSTGDMKYVDNFVQLGAELAAVAGPVTVQAEYQRTDVDRLKTTAATVTDHSFDGYYVQAMVFLTRGDRRPYLVSEGEFGRVVPKRSAGAVELGLRFSTLNLDDKTATDAILGGEAKNLTAGLTWFMNTNHKLMVNFTRVDNGANAKPGKDWAPIPAGTSTAQNVILGDDFKIFAIRYQIAF